jgi:hypothetical protein
MAGEELSGKILERSIFIENSGIISVAVIGAQSRHEMT